MKPQRTIKCRMRLSVKIYLKERCRFHPILKSLKQTLTLNKWDSYIQLLCFEKTRQQDSVILHLKLILLKK